MTKATHSYKGKQSIADIKLNKYPDNLLDIVRSVIKLSNLTIVNEVIHDFGEGSGHTALWVLSESHFTLHEYPESNYITLDCYTCGENGNPVLPMIELTKILDVSNFEIRTFNRGRI